MAMAYLGFNNGPSLSFRIDPEEITWSFQADTRVFNTIGGRVIQVLGGTLSDMTITGSFGEDRYRRHNGTPNGESWKLQRAFISKIQEMMAWQSRDATMHRQYSEKMHEPAKFVYSPRGWNFDVYIKSISDPDGGGSATIRTGKFSHKYVLTLFIVETGSSNIRHIKNKGINDYINRISDGIGWKYSQYNGEGLDNIDPYSDEWAQDLEEDLQNSGLTGGRGIPGGSVSPDGSEAAGPGNNIEFE